MSDEILEAKSKTSWSFENALYIQNIISLWAGLRYQKNSYKTLCQGKSNVNLDDNLWLFYHLKKLLLRQQITSEIYFLRKVETGEYLACLLDSAGMLWNMTGFDGVRSSIAHFYLPKDTLVFMEKIKDEDIDEIPPHKRREYHLDNYLNQCVNPNQIKFIRKHKEEIFCPILLSNEEADIISEKFKPLLQNEVIEKEDVRKIIGLINAKIPLLFILNEQNIQSIEQILCKNKIHQLYLKIKNLLKLFHSNRECILDNPKLSYQLSETLTTLGKLQQILATPINGEHIQIFDTYVDSPFFHKKLYVNLSNEEDEKTLIRFISLGALNESYFNEIDSYSLFMGMGFWGRGAIKMNSEKQIINLITDLNHGSSHHLYYEEQQFIKKQVEEFRIKKSFEQQEFRSLKKERF